MSLGTICSNLKQILDSENLTLYPGSSTDSKSQFLPLYNRANDTRGGCLGGVGNASEECTCIGFLNCEGHCYYRDSQDYSLLDFSKSGCPSFFCLAAAIPVVLEGSLGLSSTEALTPPSAKTFTCLTLLTILTPRLPLLTLWWSLEETSQALPYSSWPSCSRALYKPSRNSVP